MASDRPPPDVSTYSPVPASTYSLKEKIKLIFLEEAQYLYQTFLTVNSVSLNGTLSISINGNEEIGVIEVSETTERNSFGDVFPNQQYGGSTATSYSSPGAPSQKEGSQLSGISKMAKPFPTLPPKPKVFDKNWFDKVTSLGRLELMRKYDSVDNDQQPQPKNLTVVSPTTDTRWTGSATSGSAGSSQDHPIQLSTETPIDDLAVSEDIKLEPEQDPDEDWMVDEDNAEEDNEDKKDEDYLPEIGEEAAVADEAEEEDGNEEEAANDEEADNDEDWLESKRRSKRKPGLKRKLVTKSVVPKKRGRKTAAKLSLKIKLKQLTSVKPKTKVKKDSKKEPQHPIPADLTCTLCQKKFDTKRAYKRHSDRHWKSFQCDECGKPFSSMDSLTHHKRGLHSSTKPYSCEECGTTFNFHHSYKLHMRKHRGERPYQCDQCQKSYLTATHLKAHKEAIHETGTMSQFVCDTCGKTFTYRNSLKTHQMIHTGDRPYKCSICEKGFVTRQALKTHEESYHVQERNFQCDICLKFYKSEHLRNVHRRRHTSDVNRFMCDICGRQFMFKSNLEAHSFVHQDERPFVCNVCQKSFKCMSSLYTHQYTHKTTTPFKCGICTKTFKTKNCCKAHEKRHNAKKNFMCSTCGACFPDKGGLTKHIRTIHSPQKQFICKLCRKVGTRADNMRTHIKSHGKELGGLDASEFIVEILTSGDNQDIQEIAEKSLELSRQMLSKAETDVQLHASKVSTQTQDASVYPQTSHNQTSIHQTPRGVNMQLPITYQPSPVSPPQPVYQAPVSPSAHVYQAPMSPSAGMYQPPLSPRNYPCPPSPHRESPSHHMLNAGVPHQPDPMQTALGQSHILQPLVTVSSHLQPLQPPNNPMPAHLHNHDHGPPVFPPLHPHGQLGGGEGHHPADM